MRELKISRIWLSIILRIEIFFMKDYAVMIDKFKPLGYEICNQIRYFPYQAVFL